MQKFTMKLWSAAAVAAATALSAPVFAQEAPAPSESVYPTGFEKAVSLMLAGEGGEGGLGMHKVWPTLSLPALNGKQVAKALAGNSLAMPYHYTIQFGANGSVGGYNIKYTEVAAKKCPKVEVPGDGLLLYEGVCSQQTNEPITGTWKVENHQLCLDARWESDKVNECFHVFFALDSVALVSQDGNLWHKAHQLKAGAAPDM